MAGRLGWLCSSVFGLMPGWLRGWCSPDRLGGRSDWVRSVVGWAARPAAGRTAGWVQGPAPGAPAWWLDGWLEDATNVTGPQRETAIFKRRTTTPVETQLESVKTGRWGQGERRISRRLKLVLT